MHRNQNFKYCIIKIIVNVQLNIGPFHFVILKSKLLVNKTDGRTQLWCIKATI